MVQRTDRDVAVLIEQRQRAALDYSQPAALRDSDEPLPEVERAAYERNPSPSTTEVPEGFEAAEDSLGEEPADVASEVATTMATSAPASQPTQFRARVFTLTDALAYAQRHRREYQTAKEDLYLSALALTLEHHLWTPQFAASLRGVYGNYGEIRDFDQATRFVADLSVAQRLPYGGEFTAAMISTLIRDVGRSITASESSQIQLGLEIPFLRDAGQVAQENLIQLERALTYAVRRFERFRRQQLVTVAEQYFSLLASKQAVIDAAASFESAKEDLARAIGFQNTGKGSPLETGRVEVRVLQQQGSLATRRESFRAATDRFKILVGMPVSEPIGLDDLEDIDSIEQQIVEGKYPLLGLPSAAGDPEYATAIASRHRLDLLTSQNQIGDAERGVSIAKNALLPNLDWTSSLTYDTDPEHYKLGAFEQARATWRTEVLLSMNDRFRERNDYRSSLIDVRRARRDYTEELEWVRAEVLSAINQIHLQEQLVEVRRRNLQVADNQRRFARDRYEKGYLSNRDLVEAEDEYVRVQNLLNEAKTARWSALLNFRLATGTLRIDENGVQDDALATQPAQTRTPARPGAG
jgi:outer membrane protein TolC